MTYEPMEASPISPAPGGPGDGSPRGSGAVGGRHRRAREKRPIPVSKPLPAR